MRNSTHLMIHPVLLILLMLPTIYWGAPNRRNICSNWIINDLANLVRLIWLWRNFIHSGRVEYNWLLLLLLCVIILILFLSIADLRLLIIFIVAGKAPASHPPAISFLSIKTNIILLTRYIRCIAPARRTLHILLLLLRYVRIRLILIAIILLRCIIHIGHILHVNAALICVPVISLIQHGVAFVSVAVRICLMRLILLNVLLLIVLVVLLSLAIWLQLILLLLNLVSLEGILFILIVT